MTQDERRLKTLTLVALGKAYNDYSSYLIGEMKLQTKMEFNISVAAINTFVKGIEKRLQPEEVEFLEDITELISNNVIYITENIKTK